jgi:predicted amidophosphoribosyltransferase
VIRLVDDFLDLFLPASCVACGESGAMLCAGCAAALAGPVRPVVPPPAGVPPCWAGGRYDGALRDVILAYKERQRHSLAGPLGALLADAIGAALGRADRPDTAGRGAAEAAAREPVRLIPVPSTAQAVRARGGDHLTVLAHAAARRLRRRGRPAVVVPLLTARGRRVDSVGLDAAARRANVAGGFRVSPRYEAMVRRGSDAELVLVDDLVTTGATLAEATRTLFTAGWPVRHVAVLAATHRRDAPPARREPNPPGRGPPADAGNGPTRPVAAVVNGVPPSQSVACGAAGKWCGRWPICAAWFVTLCPERVATPARERGTNPPAASLTSKNLLRLGRSSNFDCRQG